MGFTRTGVQPDIGRSRGAERPLSRFTSRMASPPPPSGAPQRTRLLLAAGIAAVLAALVILVWVLSGSDEKHEYEPAPKACIDTWNGNSVTLVLGQHQASAHRYSRVQVVRFGKNGAVVPSTQTSAPCGVVFASSSLDSELAAAAMIQEGDTFRALSDKDIPTETLADLQFGAQEAYNALINASGTIEGL